MTLSVGTRPVRQDGLTGVLCTPGGLAPAPGVLLLGGSEGGFHERDARLLAAHGFTVFAQAYFGLPGLPPGLTGVPLEAFFRGLDFLTAQPRAGGTCGVVGGSRGGEAALLIAAHDERIGAAVSVAGSGIVTAGIDFRRGGLVDILGDPPVNSWTLGGDDLPYLRYEVGEELRDRVARRAPVGLRLAFPPVPADPVELDRVAVPVEKTAGAVLLLAGDDDQNWPSADYSRVAADRLSGHPHPVEFRLLAGAGHLIAGPPGTTQTSTRYPGPGVTFEAGGTPAANTAAREQAWQATVDFLEASLVA